MQIFGASAPSFPSGARQSMHALAHYQSEWMQHQLELHPMLSITSKWAEQGSNFSTNQQRELSRFSDASSGLGSDVFSVQSGSSDDYGPDSAPPFPPKLPDKRSKVETLKTGHIFDYTIADMSC